MRTTFINQNSENTIVEEGEKHMKSRLEDLEYYSVFGSVYDDGDFIDTLKDQDFDLEETEQAIDNYRNLSLFSEYGLSFDFVAVGTFDDQEEAYYRFQFSWGGPSEELRFYEDGTIIFAYMEWFSGVGFDVSNEDSVIWLYEMYVDTESINWANIPYEERYTEDAE